MPVDSNDWVFNIDDRVQFQNLGKFKRRPLFPPPEVGTPHVYEGDLGTVVWLSDGNATTSTIISVRPDGKLHPHGERAGWGFRIDELRHVRE